MVWLLTLAAGSGTGGILLWVVLPYIALAVFVLGHIWRYRYDKFGWTTRSSPLYERRLLRIGSPLFHFGILVVLLGHICGLVIPKSCTEAVGISEHAYHVSAVVLGTIAGVATVAGLAILINRRRIVGPVFSATTRNDKAMYVVQHVVRVGAREQAAGQFAARGQPPLPAAAVLVQAGVVDRDARRGRQGAQHGLVLVVEFRAAALVGQVQVSEDLVAHPHRRTEEGRHRRMPLGQAHSALGAVRC